MQGQLDGVLGLDVRRGSTGDTKANWTSFLRSQGRASEAVAVYEDVLPSLRDVLGEDHPNTLTVQQNLGVALVDEGRCTEARALLEATLAGYERTAGPDHPTTLAVGADLALAYDRLGLAEPAEELLRRSLSGTSARLGRLHPETDSRRKDYLVFLHGQPGRAADCLRLAEESVEAQRAHGGDRPGLLRSLANLATLQNELGRPDEAEACLLEALAGTRELFGAEHLETLLTESALVAIYCDQQRFAAAEEVAHRTVEVAARTLPADSVDLARFRGRYGIVLRHLGDDAAALEQFRPAHVVFERVFGPGHRWTRVLGAHRAELGDEL